jgi:hypothetical protein
VLEQTDYFVKGDIAGLSPILGFFSTSTKQLEKLSGFWKRHSVVMSIMQGGIYIRTIGAIGGIYDSDGKKIMVF